MKDLEFLPGFSSVFDTVFDVVVLGGGYAGFAAARELARSGKQTLLLEPSGQMLWESTQALQNRHGDGEECGAWRIWIAQLDMQGKVRGPYFDPAAAEVEAAREILSGAPGLRALFYSMPVAVEVSSGEIAAIVVATKVGFRRIRSARWVDASEDGLLAALYAPANRTMRRNPVLTHRLCLQSTVWEKFDQRLEAFCEERGLALGRSARTTERCIDWEEGGDSWHGTLMGLLGGLREAVCAGPEVVVSQCASRGFCTYSIPPEAPIPDLPGNMLVLSPALSDRSFDSLAARFVWGCESARRWMDSWSDPAGVANVGRLAEPEPEKCIRADVAVVGTGTSGALAALAAGKLGADVIALEFASFPGGVGTGAAISGYFHGIEGGLQVETDRLTSRMDGLLQGESPSTRRWHYESKKLAILSAFEQAKVRFLGGVLIAGVEKDEDGRITAILAASGAGLIRIEARTFVDCTGDGDLCTLAGNEFQIGRSGDGRTLAYSQPALVLKEISDRLVVSTENFDAGWADPTDPEDLSRARLEGVAHYHGARAANRSIFAIAPLPGIRQSRQVETDYKLTFSDLVEHSRFSDSVGQAGSIADTHSIDYEFEDDQAIFFYWVCRLFRYPLRTDLPYRMLLPKSLRNVWIACRAAGMENNASYAVRMQRDMQRLGEAAGVAAAIAARNGGLSRGVKMEALQTILRGREGSGDEPESSEALSSLEAERLLQAGEPGIHLWRISQDPKFYHQVVRRALDSSSPAVSFYAATIFAMWNDVVAEPRFVEAIARRESGPPASMENTGAHGQEIDIPFWLLAVILLRRCGTSACLPCLREMADDSTSILNVRTALALTLERLSLDGRILSGSAADAAAPLVRHPLADHLLAPSRSTWRTLRNEEQVVLRNSSGIDVREDHLWQLHLIVCRIRARIGIPIDDLAGAYRGDSRAIVRQAFAALSA
jgi:glycine/D-amino acid oxidase-like deaminating enzyme